MIQCILIYLKHYICNPDFIACENILEISLKEMCKEQGYIGVRLVIEVHSMWGPRMEGLQDFLSGIVVVSNPRGIVSSFAVPSSALLCGFDLHKDEIFMTNCTCHIQYNHLKNNIISGTVKMPLLRPSQKTAPHPLLDHLLLQRRTFW